jgi:phosphatidylserine/phosphatidylglycerophosphate/cardiolipin synthase-like enzyme
MLILPSTSVAFILPPTKAFETSAFTLQTFSRNMNVTTFVGPDYSNETLTQFLRSATESIFVEIYQFTSPGMLELIHEVYAANPSLDIKVLISEHVVSEGEYNTYTAWNLTQLGIPVRWTSNTFTFSHQKFVIIDNDTTIVQAGNWARPSVPLNDWQSGSSMGFTKKNYDGNREFNIAMTDQVVTQYYRNVFDNDWGIGSAYNEVADGTGTPLTWGSPSLAYYPRVFNYTGHFSGQMNVTPVFSPDTSLQAILWVINSAQATLDIEIPYVSNSSTVVREVLNALVSARNRGVSIRIIMEPPPTNDNEEVSLAFAKENIPIIWMDHRFFATLHNKAFIADGRVVLICSINWSEESIAENREAGVIIEHDGVGAWYQAVFEYDWGLADYDAPGYVNVGWNPHIPTSTSPINVTVFAHEYTTYSHVYTDDIDEVKIGVKIGDGVWTNYTITSNVYLSSERNDENFFHVIDPQPDGTNITVRAYILSGGVWSSSLDMLIPVRNTLGSVITTPVPTTNTDNLTQLIIELAPYIVVAIVVAIGGLCVKKKR